MYERVLNLFEYPEREAKKKKELDRFIVRVEHRVHI